MTDSIRSRAARPASWHPPTVKLLTALIVVALLAAACSSGASTTSPSKSGKSQPAASAGSATTPTQLRFRGDGTPNLSGVSLSLGNSAGSAVASDSVTFLVTKVLDAWGAHTQYTLGQFNTNDIAVKAGRLTSNAGEMFGELDAGLTAFGPNAVHVDYVLATQSSITSENQLLGKTFAVTSRTGPDYAMLQYMITKNHWSPSQVHTVFTNNAQSNVSELFQGAVQASWVHANDILTLNAHGHFNVLDRAATLVPYLADSYMAADPTWLTSNPAYAEAVDLAWIEAANVFNNNPTAWEQAAVGYTHGAESTSEVKATYAALAEARPWSLDNEAEFTADAVAKNYALDQQSGEIKGLGNRPESQYADFTPWQAAWSYYQAHQAAFSGTTS